MHIINLVQKDVSRFTASSYNSEYKENKDFCYIKAKGYTEINIPIKCKRTLVNYATKTYLKRLNIPNKELFYI